MATIACRYGFGDGAALHDHPDNADLKARRPDPSLLYPGDEITIPDEKVKTFALATGQRHRIVIKRPRRHLNVRLRDFDRSDYQGHDFKLFFDGDLAKEGVAAAGKVEHTVPLLAKHGRIEAGDYAWDFELGALNPIEQTADAGASGTLGRLYGLGYDLDVASGDLASARTRAAVRWFQRDHGIEPSGELTDDTRAAIIAAHGC